LPFRIPPVGHDLDAALRARIDAKTKPPGSLGFLEHIAFQLGVIQQSTTPEIRDPHIFVFAGDHGITAEGVSPYPSEVTRQMVLNFLAGGAAINVFARLNQLSLRIVDAGVDGDFPDHPTLIQRKIARGTANMLHQPSMTVDQCARAMQQGAGLVEERDACNLIGFGEMGIGNTSSAAVLMYGVTGIPLEKCVGRGTGLDDPGLAHKRAVLQKAVERHGVPEDPRALLATYGGFELAMMTGAMLAAAQQRMTLVIDGFIVTAALLIAQKIAPNITDYCIFAHRGEERGHGAMLDYLGVRPLLDLDLRLGEGTGAALAVPLIRAAAAFMNEMATFEDAGVSDRDA
jgi:nicotinate-nucleotide--dimethylbenzimidazole phosphoribosyltransferase